MSTDIFTEADEWRMANPRRTDSETEALRERAQLALVDDNAYDLGAALSEALDATIATVRKGYDGVTPFAASHGRIAHHG